MNLIEIRFRKKITQWDLSLKTGISQSKLSLMERGYIAPSDREKALIGEAMECNAQAIKWPSKIKAGTISK